MIGTGRRDIVTESEERPGRDLHLARTRLSFKQSLVAITILALMVHLAYLAAAWHTPLYSDAQTFRALGRSLVDGRGYIRPKAFHSGGASLPSAQFPPMYPLLLAGFDLVGAGAIWIQRLLLTVLSLGTVILIGLLGRRVAGPTVGIIAAALAAVYPMIWMSDAALMSESLYLFLVVASLLLLYRVIAKPRQLWSWAFLGATMGLTALTRSEGIWLPVVVGVPAALLTGDRIWRVRLLRAAVVAGACAAVIAPWSIRNSIRFHSFVPLSTSLGPSLLGANCPQSYNGVQTGSWVVTCVRATKGSAVNQAALSSSDQRAALSYARSHAGRLPVVVVARVLRLGGLFHTSQEISYESNEGRVKTVLWAGTVMFWLLAAVSAAGIWLTRRDRRMWPLLAGIGVVIVPAALVFGNQRFRIGAEPAILVLAAVALERWGVSFASRSGRRLLHTGP